MLDRRRFLASAAAIAAAAALPGRSAVAGQSSEIRELLDAAMNRLIQSSPQIMTILRLDTGAQSSARRELDDRSPAGVARFGEIFSGLRQEIAAYDPAQLSGADRLNHQSAAYLADTIRESFAFPFGDPQLGIAAPYVISQLTGAYRNIPSFLANQHPVETAEDAEAYLSRLAAFPRLLDQETERARGDFARGAVPPNFVLATSLRQFEALMAPPPSRGELVSSLARRARENSIAGDWEARATAIVESDVLPALQRQAQLLTDAVPTAPPEAGVWRFPRGEEYYAFAVRAATTTSMPAAEIHALGLDLVAELSARANLILRRQGLTRGSVAQRIAALRQDPRQLYEESAAGRAALLRELESLIRSIDTYLPRYFGRLPQAGLEVRRMSTAIEAGATGATYQPPSLDGSRPGLFSINLRDLSEWPRFDLPTLVHHEASPGHHLQNAVAMGSEDLPLMRRLPIFSGYSEGWALYAEQLAEEMGVYEEDPLGRLGYVSAMLFRAARLVVDSGLHHKRWSRGEAITYMSETLGNAEGTAVREVERYCVQPGQACSYMLGWRTWTEARSRARDRLGGVFDLKAFHDRGLRSGSMPLDVLAQVLGTG